MNTPEWQQSLLESIQKLEELENMQADIDATYSTLCKALLTEVDRHFTCFNAKKATKKRLKFHKPYWNSELSFLWRDMKQAGRSRILKISLEQIFIVKIKNSINLYTVDAILFRLQLIYSTVRTSK